MNNQLAQIRNAGPPAIQTDIQKSNLFAELPLLLLVFCLSVMFISLFIPIAMSIVSTALLFAYMVPLPLEKRCTPPPTDGTFICNPIYKTAWNYFLEGKPNIYNYPLKQLNGDSSFQPN